MMLVSSQLQGRRDMNAGLAGKQSVCIRRCRSGKTTQIWKGLQPGSDKPREARPAQLNPDRLAGSPAHLSTRPLCRRRTGSQCSRRLPMAARASGVIMNLRQLIGGSQKSWRRQAFGKRAGTASSKHGGLPLWSHHEPAAREERHASMCLGTSQTADVADSAAGRHARPAIALAGAVPTMLRRCRHSSTAGG